MIIRSSSDKRSYTGNRIELVCEAEAVPPPTWSWKRNGESLLANGYGIVVDSEGLITKLELTTHADEDYGKYACVAENDQGTAESPPIEVIQVGKQRILADLSDSELQRMSQNTRYLFLICNPEFSCKFEKILKFKNLNLNV